MRRTLGSDKQEENLAFVGGLNLEEICGKLQWDQYVGKKKDLKN